MKKLKKILKIILIMIPGLLGFYGFMQIEDLSISWGIYHSLKLYSFSTPDIDLNIYIEIARWLAPLATAGILVIVFQSLQTGLRKILVAKRKDSCSVYGDGQDARNLLKDLGNTGIAGSDKILNTKYHVLLFDNEQEGLAFYNEHKKELGKGKVYLELDRIPARSIQKNGIVAFSMAENCAATYWIDHPTVSKTEKIAIIGNGVMPDALLTKALLLNIVDVNQKLEYHIWNDNNDYSDLHTQLTNIMMDSISFHQNESGRYVDLLNTMDRIILCSTDEENICRAGEFLEYTSKPDIYIRVRNAANISVIFNNDRIIPYGQSQRLATKNIIINEALLDRAKKIHQNYVTLYGGDTWENLEEFKKRSNISSAEYHIVLRRLFDQGVEVEKLAELEHIRWCRFHILNNWQYGPEVDKIKRTHNLLIDYINLDENQKQKDREVVEIALNREINSTL